MTLVRLLEDAGIRVEIEDQTPGHRTGPDAVVALNLDDSIEHLAVSVRRRAPYPGEIAALDGARSEIAAAGIPTLVAPYVSEPTGRRLAEAGWCWADSVGNADLRAPGLRIQRRTAARLEISATSRLPSGTGSLSIIRLLITTGECPGPTRLAQAVGLTQPRASQVLDQLTRSGLVDREGRTMWTVHREALLDAFVSHYRGPGGSEQHFYTVGSLEDAFTELAEAHGRTRGEPVSLSGDLAADRIAPWRRPETLLVYTPSPLPADEISLVDALGPDDANVIIRNPADRSLFGVDPIGSGLLRLVDPTQIIWDLLNQGGSDRQEAADKVTAWLLSR